MKSKEVVRNMMLWQEEKEQNCSTFREVEKLEVLLVISEAKFQLRFKLLSLVLQNQRARRYLLGQVQLLDQKQKHQ